MTPPPSLPGTAGSGKKHKLLMPRTLALFALVGIIAGYAWTLHAGPKPLSWYPRCVMFSLTGLYCPGCGSARAIHAVAHGLFAEAAGRNLLLACMAPFLLFWSAVSFQRALTRNLPPPALPTKTARIALIVVLLFTVARNLPWWPFSLLAP